MIKGQDSAILDLQLTLHAPCFEVERTQDFDFLSEEYEALFHCSDASAFQHPLWLSTLYKWLAPSCDVTPLILVGRNRTNRRLAFVLPLFERRFGPIHIAEFADLRVCDYCTAIHDPTTFPSFLDDPIAKAALDRELAAFSLVFVRNSRSDALFPSEVFRSKASRLFHAHEVSIYGPFERWRSQALDPSFSRYLDRKRKRFVKSGRVRFQELRDKTEIEEAFNYMRAFRGERFPGTDLLQQPKYFDFYVKIALDGADNNFARTYSLSRDGRPAAVLFGLSHRQRFLFSLLGFDSAELKSHSLGLLALEDAIRDCAERGDHVFDMTIGDEPYKSSFSNVRTPIFAQWTGRGAIGSLAGAATTGLLQLRALSKRKRSQILRTLGGVQVVIRKSCKEFLGRNGRN